MLRTKLLILPMMALSVSLMAQGDEHLSAKSRRYEDYRNTVTEPSYGLAKVKALIKRIKPDKEYNQRLPGKKFSALSFNEKFTYTMLHGEDQSQNCDEMPSLVGAEHRIFSYPAPFNDGTAWSDRQEDFLKDNRPRVLGLIKETIKTHRRVGVNLKEAIIDLRAQEMIPDILAVYNKDRKDQDILSVCMVLMNIAKYKPFMNTRISQQLYGQSASYKGFVEANSTNAKQVEGFAIAFSKTKPTYDQ